MDGVTPLVYFVKFARFNKLPNPQSICEKITIQNIDKTVDRGVYITLGPVIQNNLFKYNDTLTI